MATPKAPSIDIRLKQGRRRPWLIGGGITLVVLLTFVPFWCLWQMEGAGQDARARRHGLDAGPD